MANKVSTPENIKYLIENYEKFPKEHFIEKFGTTLSYFKVLVFRNKLGHRAFHKFMEENKEKILNLYAQGVTYTEISKIFGVDNATIKRFLLKNNINLRPKSESYKTYQINENFFNKIESENQAYWLGFMYADGCVRPNNHVKLTLHINDDYMIRKFRSDLNSNHPLVYEKGKNVSNFLAVNQKLREDLEKLGCVHRKSLILKFPTFDQVPEYLIHHFIRGYFDGDGCITSCIDKRRNQLTWKLSIASTPIFLNGVSKELVKNGLPKTQVILDKQCDNKIGRLQFGSSVTTTGIKNLEKLFSYLYKDATIFLHRKKDRIESLISNVYNS